MGRLATTRPDRSPHLVPVTFAVTSGHVVTGVDHKPKSTRRLQRLTNVEESGMAALLVDHYEEDWSRLWWVRMEGRASVHIDDDAAKDALRALEEKYAQYQAEPPEGPFIRIALDEVTWWQGS